MFLAEAPVTNPLVKLPWCGEASYLDLKILKFHYCAFTPDTLISSGIAFIVTLLIAALIASRLRPGRPGKLQVVFEGFYYYVRGMAEGVDREAAFIVPIAMTIFLYILVANWIDFFPLGAISQLLPGGHEIKPATASFEQTLALAVVVIGVVQWYQLKVNGLRGYLKHFTKPFDLPLVARVLFIPLNIIEELAKPLTLALRLFGNLFAGLLMVWLLTSLLRLFLANAALLAVWKLFDVFFVGTLQAFIFMLLTVIYFGMAREVAEHEAHRAHSDPAAAH